MGSCWLLLIIRANSGWNYWFAISLRIASLAAWPDLDMVTRAHPCIYNHVKQPRLLLTRSLAVGLGGMGWYSLLFGRYSRCDDFISIQRSRCLASVKVLKILCDISQIGWFAYSGWGFNFGRALWASCVLSNWPKVIIKSKVFLRDVVDTGWWLLHLIFGLGIVLLCTAGSAYIPVSFWRRYIL